MHFFQKLKPVTPALNDSLDYSKLISSIKKDEFISLCKSSANYYIQQQSLNYMYMMKHQIL